MAEGIQGLFVHPPMAAARLGASPTPLDAFEWIETDDPHTLGETVISPTWTLDVGADGSVMPRMPEKISFRDGSAIRPLAPFFELWALVGEATADPATWKQAPLTPALLKEFEVGLDDLSLTAEAKNRKVARRTGNVDLIYGTFPAVTLTADSQAPVNLTGTSPPGVKSAMIPVGTGIPMGSVRILKSTPQPPPGTSDGTDAVDIEVLRFRFTPPAGLFYGPPDATKPQRDSRGFGAVAPAQAFLNPRTDWVGYTAPNASPVEPADTFDVTTPNGSVSLGVVDDTSEVRFTVQLKLGRQKLTASATAFVAPPDFAPDRRPFLSMADELIDRGAPRPVDLNGADDWAEDLFERIFETVSLMNVDVWRNARAARLPKSQQRANPIPQDQTSGPTTALGPRDLLRDETIPLKAASAKVPLPVTERAVARHRELSDLGALMDFVRGVHNTPGGPRPNLDRLRDLIRPPFTLKSNENGNATTMQMPPFMRQSNALPLTLSNWQYDVLFAWFAQVASTPVAPVAALAAAPPKPLSERARRRQREVLDRLARGGR